MRIHSAFALLLVLISMAASAMGQVDEPDVIIETGDTPDVVYVDDDIDVGDEPTPIVIDDDEPDILVVDGEPDIVEIDEEPDVVTPADADDDININVEREDEDTPGFELVFAVAGVLAGARLLRRRS